MQMGCSNALGPLGGSYMARWMIMDQLMNRSRAFAEAVVVMVCPVLLALALKKVDLKSEDHGLAVPMVMLIMAGLTLFTGICPLLVSCCSSSHTLPGTVTKCLAPISSICLVVLDSLIAQLIVPKKIVIPIGILSVVCILAYKAFYWYEQNNADGGDDTLKRSNEFLSAVTGFLFLGLEGLALEGQISRSQGSQPRLRAAMGITFGACALGVFLVFLEMIPPRKAAIPTNVAGFTAFLDAIMAIATVAVLVAITIKAMGLPSLLLLAPLLSLLLLHVYLECNDDGVAAAAAAASEPASMELTKVTFTGFLAVSVAAISSGLVISTWTKLFLGFTSTAIVSGLVWRLLTHAASMYSVQIDRLPLAQENAAQGEGGMMGMRLARTANAASFLTHFCVGIATVPFAVIASKSIL